MNTIEFLTESFAEFLCLFHPLCDIHFRKNGLWRSRYVLTANHHIDGIAFLIDLNIDTWSQLAVIKTPSVSPSMGRAKGFSVEN